MDITVWPCTDIIDGDKEFADPVVYKGYAVHKEGVTITASGEEVKIKSIVYFPGDIANKLTDQDEVQVPFGTRTPIQSMTAHPALTTGWEMVTVYL